MAVILSAVLVILSTVAVILSEAKNLLFLPGEVYRSLENVLAAKDCGLDFFFLLARRAIP